MALRKRSTQPERGIDSWNPLPSSNSNRLHTSSFRPNLVILVVLIATSIIIATLFLLRSNFVDTHVTLLPRCNGAIIIGLPKASPTRLFRVRVGECNLLFAPDSRCPIPTLSRISNITRLQHLPCTNLSITLSAHTPLLTLRAFGVRSRRHSSLPFQVQGALIPYHVQPFVALDTPDDRPYTWQSNIPPASTCTTGKCRPFIRAMLLAYLSGCGPLHSDSLWRRNDDDDNDADDVLLAFPQGCSPNSTDVIAHDLVVRYLRVSCEVPRRFWNGVKNLKHDEHVEIRARQLIQLLRNTGGWWSARRNEICKNGVQMYRYDGDTWEKALIPQWKQQLGDVAAVAARDEMT